MKRKTASIIGSLLAMPILVSGLTFTNVMADEPEEYSEPTFNLTYDFNNGATFEGEDSVTYNMAAIGLDLNYERLVDCFDYNSELDECHPIDIKKGKALSYITLNGERHDLGPDDGFILNEDTTIVYYWDDIELEEFELDDGAGNSIVFDGETDHIYAFEVINYSANMTEEEWEEEDIPYELYENTRRMILEAIGEEKGTLLALMDLSVYDENKVPLHEGPFDVTLAMSEEMKGYNTYKLIYLEDDEDGNLVAGETVILTLDGNTLTGTLPHLSAYALIGSNETPAAPNSGFFSKVIDSVTFLPLTLASIVLSIVIVAAFVYKKAKN